MRVRQNYGWITLETSALWNDALVLLITRSEQPLRVDAYCSQSIEWEDWDESTIDLNAEC